MRLLFIVLDGVDGCGKTTQVKNISKYLKSKGFSVLNTSEPSDSVFGKKARKILKSEKDPQKNAELCLGLFVKDREHHLKNVIEPFLSFDNRAVVCDRYYYSTIAYQHTQGLSWRRVLNANSGFKKPNLAFIFDLPIKIAMQRMALRGTELEKFEKIEFMEELSDNFLDLKNRLSDNLFYIDALGDENEVFSKVKAVLEKYCKN